MCGFGFFSVYDLAMSIDNLSEIYRAQLSETDFEKLGSMIYQIAGIKMPPSKKVMVQARLKKRLRALGMNSFPNYVDYVFSKEGLDAEIVHILDVISTNKTDFFRESIHFSFLSERVLPVFAQRSEGKLFKVWSAGCSSGEEAYTLAMVLNEFGLKVPGFDFSILGTDISTTILAMAKNAVFAESRLKPAVPERLIRRYFMKSKDPVKKWYRIIPEIRRKTQFSRLNFMDDRYPVTDMFDVVFCRNVLIYFDRDTQEQVVRKICNHLKPGGYLFHGHSESLIGMDLPLKNIQSTIFRKI